MLRPSSDALIGSIPRLQKTGESALRQVGFVCSGGEEYRIQKGLQTRTQVWAVRLFSNVPGQVNLQLRHICDLNLNKSKRVELQNGHTSNA